MLCFIRKHREEKVVKIIYEKIQGKEASGIILFEGLKIPFVSGKWGNGYAPEGIYKAENITLLDPTMNTFNSYAKQNLGWFIPIIPQFKTDRSGLGIHPDGGIPGTLGCIGVLPRNLNENVKYYSAFYNYFKENKDMRFFIAKKA